jgi:hypothetical protein
LRCKTRKGVAKIPFAYKRASALLLKADLARPSYFGSDCAKALDAKRIELDEVIE